MCTNGPKSATEFTLKWHTGDPARVHENVGYDQDLPENSLIYQGSLEENRPKLLI